MRVTCPACAATYDVPDARIGAGRRLRCARCQNDWFVSPPAPAERPPAESAFARAVELAARPITPTEPRRAPAPATSDSAFDPQPLPVAKTPGPADSGFPAPVDRPDMPSAPAARPPGRRDGAHPAVAAEPRSTLPLQISTEPRPASRPSAVAQVDRSGSLMVAWVASLMLFFGFAAAVLLYRIEIMEAWPPAERLYAAFGMLRR